MVSKQNEALRLAAMCDAEVVATVQRDILMCEAAAELRRLHAEVNRLRTIIDSRPAINAGLPATYIEWSQSIYEMDMAHAIANVTGGFQ
jgi:hypothetical protein